MVTRKCTIIRKFCGVSWLWIKFQTRLVASSLKLVDRAAATRALGDVTRPGSGTSLTRGMRCSPWREEQMTCAERVRASLRDEDSNTSPPTLGDLLHDDWLLDCLLDWSCFNLLFIFKCSRDDNDEDSDSGDSIGILAWEPVMNESCDPPWCFLDDSSPSNRGCTNTSWRCSSVDKLQEMERGRCRLEWVGATSTKLLQSPLPKKKERERVSDS